MELLEHKWLYSSKRGCIQAKWFGSDKTGCIRVKYGLFGQSCGIWAELVVLEGKLVVFGQKCLQSGKNGCLRPKWLYSAKRIYSGKVIAFGQEWFIRAKLFGSGETGCTRGKLVLFGQSCGIPQKLVVFRQSGCIRGKSGCTWAKIVVFGAKVVLFGQ